MRTAALAKSSKVLFRCTEDAPLREFFEWQKQIQSKFGKAK